MYPERKLPQKCGREQENLGTVCVQTPTPSQVSREARTCVTFCSARSCEGRLALWLR